MENNKYKRVREQKTMEEINNNSNEANNLSSTKMSLDYFTSKNLDFSCISNNKNLSIKKQRLHQIILCIKFFNEQIQVQNQILATYNNIDNNNNVCNNSVNIYKRQKKEVKNNVNKNIHNNNIYLKSYFEKEYQNAKEKLVFDFNTKLKDKENRLKENRDKIINDCNFIIKNLEEASEVYKTKKNDGKKQNIEKEKSDEIIKECNEKLNKFCEIKKYIFQGYYQDFLNKIKNDKKKVTHHLKLKTKGVFNFNEYGSSQNTKRKSRNDEVLTTSSKSINIVNSKRQIKINDFEMKPKKKIKKKHIINSLKQL